MRTCVRAASLRNILWSHAGNVVSYCRSVRHAGTNRSWFCCRKTLLNIEGLGRQLYPELNLWDTAKPFLEKWLADRYSVQTVSRRLQQEAPALLETLPLLPDLLLNPTAAEPHASAHQKWYAKLVSADHYRRRTGAGGRYYAFQWWDCLAHMRWRLFVSSANGPLPVTAWLRLWHTGPWQVIPHTSP